MTAQELLDYLAGIGVSLKAEDGQLYSDAPLPCNFVFFKARKRLIG